MNQDKIVSKRLRNIVKMYFFFPQRGPYKKLFKKTVNEIIVLKESINMEIFFS